MISNNVQTPLILILDLKNIRFMIDILYDVIILDNPNQT